MKAAFGKPPASNCVRTAFPCPTGQGFRACQQQAVPRRRPLCSTDNTFSSDPYRRIRSEQAECNITNFLTVKLQKLWQCNHFSDSICQSFSGRNLYTSSPNSWTELSDVNSVTTVRVASLKFPIKLMLLPQSADSIWDLQRLLALLETLLPYKEQVIYHPAYSILWVNFLNQVGFFKIQPVKLTNEEQESFTISFFIQNIIKVLNKWINPLKT